MRDFRATAVGQSMILERFYDEKLAQASYMIGCGATGEAVVVDPNRDVDPYVRAAEREGVRITHVTETHIHADFVSGSRELAARTGARLYLSAEGGPDWSYGFADTDGATLLRDRDTFRVGNILIEALHTPGHTPEHLTYLVTDTAGADRPIGALTGDFIFVGDVGRPDLLERAAGGIGTMESQARELYRSIRRFLEQQPEWLQIWPGHGAGSACGKDLSSIPHSTLGYERIFNWGLSTDDEEEFVRGVLEGQPEPPTYFAEMKRINRDGPPVLGGFPFPRRLPGSRLADLLAQGELVIDVRPADSYAAEHVPGTLNIPLNRSFNTWAGWLVPYDAEFYLLFGDDQVGAIEEAVRDLALVGLERVAGVFGGDAIEAWLRSGRRPAEVPQIHADELAARLGAGEVATLDVRGEAEWTEGHIPGARNIPVGHLMQRLDEVPRDRPVVVNCQSGGRSAIAVSLLRRAGLRNVVNLRDGFTGWSVAGHESERPETAPSWAGAGLAAAERAED